MPVLSLLLVVDGLAVDFRATYNPDPSRDTPLEALLREAFDVARARAGGDLPLAPESLHLVEAVLGELNPAALGAMIQLTRALGLAESARHSTTAQA